MIDLIETAIRNITVILIFELIASCSLIRICLKLVSSPEVKSAKEIPFKGMLSGELSGLLSLLGSCKTVPLGLTASKGLTDHSKIYRVFRFVDFKRLLLWFVLVKIKKRYTKRKIWCLIMLFITKRISLLLLHSKTYCNFFVQKKNTFKANGSLL